MDVDRADRARASSGDILIVDDTPANLRLFSQMLTKQGYTVRLARTGELALSGARALPPDLILLDIRMPGMDGYEVCRHLKADARTREIPVIFLSALDQTEDKVHALAFGGVDYITKPFQFREVLARVDTHLSLYRLRRELAAANAELEAGNAELRAFAHTVAHDLKSPLSVLIGFSSLLETEYDALPREELERIFVSMSQVGYKMRDIIDALLLLANVREAEALARGPLDMSAIVDEALARLAPEIERRRAEVITTDRWPVVLGHAPWIEEVWVNYVSNALKYGGDVDAGLPPRVELGFSESPARPEGTGIRFSVRDNGSGLTPDEQMALFTPFTRFHQTRAEGHGLGLSIVQRIVEKLGGRVGVESAGPGRGCTFWFSLPAAEPPGRDSLP
jgi:signal transduction histidine kinase